MKVSVIVPVYKAEKWLHRCVDSILAQTMKDFELLLIDDGSPDKSGEICDEYAAKDSRIRVFHKENGGVSSARNLGLDNVLGKYIIFIDSDDWVSVNYIQDLYKYKDVDALIYQGHISVKNDKIVSINSFDEKEYVGENFIDFFSIPVYGFSWGKIFSSDIVLRNNIRFNENLTLWEDNIFVYEYISYVNKVRFVSEVNYFYQNTENSLTKYTRSPKECYLYYDRLSKIFSKYKIFVRDKYHYKLDEVLARNYMRSFLMLYINRCNYLERKNFYDKYRTKEGIRLVRDSYLKDSVKARSLSFCFCLSWVLFDVLQVVLKKYGGNR